jgi:hypothetical protein
MMVSATCNVTPREASYAAVKSDKKKTVAAATHLTVKLKTSNAIMKVVLMLSQSSVQRLLRFTAKLTITQCGLPTT